MEYKLFFNGATHLVLSSCFSLFIIDLGDKYRMLLLNLRDINKDFYEWYFFASAVFIMNLDRPIDCLRVLFSLILREC